MKEADQEKRQARGIVLVTHIIAAVVKIIGFLFSGSAVLMNESIHSVIDCLNQGLLAIGEKRARRGRSELYQFGEGRATYFFSTVVAMTVFFRWRPVGNHGGKSGSFGSYPRSGEHPTSCSHSFAGFY